MSCITYSQRVLCPFHGMLQTLDLDGGIAESADGFHWKLYVAHEEIVCHTGLCEVRYGDWNPRDGSSRSRIRGTAPSDLIEETGQRLIQALLSEAGKIPFEPADNQEFWLLDAQTQEPLALLESAIDRDARTIVSAPQWWPGAAAKREFRSQHGDADGLAQMLGERAGRRPLGRWFERRGDGSGMTDAGEYIEPRRFPTLFIRNDWPSPAQRGLVRDFLAWQAPWLLQLQNLDQETRAWLELSAWHRPRETSRGYRLFPEVLDPDSLITTRVKSRLLEDGRPAEIQPEPFYPFYNE